MNFYFSLGREADNGNDKQGQLLSEKFHQVLGSYFKKTKKII